MTTIYLDESGDLGFSFHKNSSKYFIISLYETDLDEKQIKKIIKISKERTIKKKENKKLEIKGYSTNIKTKQFLISQILKKDNNFKIYSIVVNKHNIIHNLRNNKRILYNKICKEIITESKISNTKLIIDKKDIKQEFTNELIEYLKKHFSNINIELNDSHNFGGLQIVDLFANSTFRYFERKEETLYSLFEDKLILKEFNFN